MRNGFVFASILTVALASTTALADNAVTLGETTADGGLPLSSAAAIIGENLSDAQGCLKDGVEVPSLIKIELTLEPDKPISARVLSATIKNRKKGRCVLEAAKTWPLSVKQRTVITQQFNVAYETEDKGEEKETAEPSAKTADKETAEDPSEPKAKPKAEEASKAEAEAPKPEAKEDAKPAEKEEKKAPESAEAGDDSKEDEAPADESKAEKEEPKEPKEPQGAIRLFRDIKIEAAMSPAAVNAKVGEQHEELLACYMALVAEKPKAAGHLDVKYTIADGKVTDATVLKSTSLKNADFSACAAEAVKKWEFEGGGITVTQRFGFTPTKYFAGKSGLVVNLTSVEGPMSAAAVIKVAVKKQRALNKCFKSSVKGKKAPITIVTADVTINAKGKAKASAVLAEPPSKKKKLTKCLTRALGKLKFKKLKKGEEGETTAKFEMVYTPKGKAFKIKKPRFR